MTTMILRNHCSETLRFPRSMSLRNDLEQPMRCAIARNEMPEDSRSFRIWIPALRFESVTVLFRYLSAHSQLRISWFTVRMTLADCIFFCILFCRLKCCHINRPEDPGSNLWDYRVSKVAEYHDPRPKDSMNRRAASALA